MATYFSPNWLLAKNGLELTKIQNCVMNRFKVNITHYLAKSILRYKNYRIRNEIALMSSLLRQNSKKQLVDGYNSHGL